MRLWSVLLIGVSALSLSACSSFKGNDGTKPDNKTQPKAAVAAPASSASAQEEKELSALMGAPTGTDATAVKDAEVVTPATELEAPAPVAETDAAPAEPVKAADTNFTPGVPDGCPAVEVLPDTKSITYFDDKDGRPIGDIVARASLTDVRGGCDYANDSVVVDIDMLMQGHITDKGRYEGRRDLEAFMTFPYFVAVMDPDGKMIDKKIMATAMRFKPEIDDLDHAEKITQTIPLKDIGLGSKYTITLGFQLNRQQLDYNRGTVSADAKPLKTTSTPVKTSEEKPAAVKADVPPSIPETKTTVKDTPIVTGPKSSSTPAPAKSDGAKMQPVVD